MIDLEKEREDFEKWYENVIGRSLVYKTYDKSYLNSKTQEAWEAWQAAKAQAVPEGFVVLKISDVREILSNASDAMDAESPSSVFTQTGIPSTWYDHHLVAEKNILDAIKAQEPAND